MPLSVRLFLLILLCLASLVCLGVPLFLHFRALRSASVVPERPSYEILLGTCLGLLAVDLVLYILYRSTLPKSFFYPTLFGLNLLCLIFAGYDCIAYRLCKQPSVLPSHLQEEEEMVIDMQPSQI